MGRWLPLFALTTVLAGANPDYQSAEAKLHRIGDRKLKHGETVVFTPREINAWARVAVPEYVPHGIREPHVELGNGTANGSALVDLTKIRSGGVNPLIANLIQGERPLKISVRLESGGGRCTVYLTRVELGEIVAQGVILNLLVKVFFLPLFPDARIDEPFDLDYDIDRIEISPDGVRVTAKR
jgi:hypothetical protein